MRVGLYERISDDRDGTEAGVTRQDKDCRRLARTLGATAYEVYRENDTSAFRRRRVKQPDGTTVSRVIRPEFRRMLDDLAAGEIDAVVAYDLDRVARDPRDLEDLIDVAESTGRPVKSVTGNLDLAHPGGITMARIAVAVANQSSRDTSRRVTRAKEENAAQGRWNGGGKRAYGLTADRTATVKKEADVIREAARRVLAGEGLNAVAADFARRKLPTSSGRPWSRTSLRGVLVRPAVAGRLVYREKDVGVAPWPAILDHDTWEAVVAEIESRPRQDQTLRHWLTGLLICSHCGAPLRGNGAAYTCQQPRGCNRTWVNRERTEALVEAAVLGYVSRLRTPKRTKREPLPDDTQLQDLATMWGKGEISLAEYRAARSPIVERLQKANTARATVKLPAWARDDLAGKWADATPVQRRQVALAVLERVVVQPNPEKRWRPERFEVHWR